MLGRILKISRGSAVALACLVVPPAQAQNVDWPSYGPSRDLPVLNGITDTLADFVGPIDGSAELTIFTEGNHYPVLLPLALQAFPSWCASTRNCHIDPGKILIVTLPQPMILQILLKGGVRLGNAVIPVGRGERVFPDFVMAGIEPLRQFAAAGITEPTATVFARHRGMGLLVSRQRTDVTNLSEFAISIHRFVMASESEPGARGQYQAALTAFLGPEETNALLKRELQTFPGRLGIQHRDVPYAILNGLADGGIIFDHLAAFYARTYPEKLKYIPVPAAERLGREIALAHTTVAHGSLSDPFLKFFIDKARDTYPAAGFTQSDKFAFGRVVALHTD
jgi:hypothetical protein